VEAFGLGKHRDRAGRCVAAGDTLDCRQLSGDLVGIAVGRQGQESRDVQPRSSVEEMPFPAEQDHAGIDELGPLHARNGPQNV